MGKPALPNDLNTDAYWQLNHLDAGVSMCFQINFILKHGCRRQRMLVTREVSFKRKRRHICFNLGAWTMMLEITERGEFDESEKFLDKGK